jgi:multidrug transporter EmrE-like cation transporter
MPVALLIVFSVGCSAAAQVALRQGMRAAEVQTAIEAGAMAPVALAVLGSLPVLGGLALYGVAAASWLFVLARLPVSVAYAFMALGLLLTMALGCLLLGEPFTGRKFLGTLAVMLGLWLVAGGR